MHLSHRICLTWHGDLLPSFKQLHQVMAVIMNVTLTWYIEIPEWAESTFNTSRSKRLNCKTFTNKFITFAIKMQNFSTQPGLFPMHLFRPVYRRPCLLVTPVLQACLHIIPINHLSVRQLALVYVLKACKNAWSLTHPGVGGDSMETRVRLMFTPAGVKCLGSWIWSTYLVCELEATY